MLGTAFQIWTLGSMYKGHRMAGSGFLGSVVKTAVDNAIWGLPLMGAYGTANMLIQGASGIGNTRIKRMQELSRPFANLSMDTQGAAEARQALYRSAVASNQTLRLSSHSWAGSEASLMHRRF